MFEFVRIPFGLRNSAHTFQRFINEVFNGLDFVFVYIEEEHIKHLNMVFERLDEYGLNIKPGKCVFGVSNIDFLSHNILEDGIKPCEDKVSAVRDFEKPKSVKQMQKFMGMVNYYHRYIPHLGKISSSIHTMITTAVKKKCKILEWNNETESSFNEIKESFSKQILLNHFDSEARLILTVDASTIAIGGVLQQIRNERVEPLALFSKKLSPAETKYSAFDRVLLAIYLNIKHFRHMLEGRNFPYLQIINP